MSFLDTKAVTILTLPDKFFIKSFSDSFQKPCITDPRRPPQVLIGLQDAQR